ARPRDAKMTSGPVERGAQLGEQMGQLGEAAIARRFRGGRVAAGEDRIDAARFPAEGPLDEGEGAVADLAALFDVLPRLIAEARGDRCGTDGHAALVTAGAHSGAQPSSRVLGSHSSQCVTSRPVCPTSAKLLMIWDNLG